jgi:hypothetical protein
VAQFSRHMSGQAIDYFIPGVPIEDVRNAGLRLQRGGVGYYPSSGVALVHMDVGSVRHWPRIPEQQLARVMNSRTTVASAKPAAEQPKRTFSTAFKQPVGEDDEEEQVPVKRTRMPAVAARAASSAPAPAPESEKPVPLPPVRPAGKPASVQVASAPHAPERPAEATAPAKPSKVFQAAAAVATRPDAPIEAPAYRPMTTFQTAAALRAPERPAEALPAVKPPKLFQVAAAVPTTTEAPIEAPASKPAPTFQGTGAPAEPSASDIISTRAIWQGPVPPIPPADIPNVSTADAKGAAGRRHPDAIEQAASGSIAPWPMPSQKRESERIPAELALAYAAQVDAKERRTPARAAAPMGATAVRAPAPAAPAAPPGSTVAIKQSAGPARVVQPLALSPPAVAPARTVQRLDNPWMRAIITTPSAQNFMTTMIIGANDFRSLRPFLQKPQSLVVMTFAEEPTPGLDTERFSGEAIVFVSTVNFSNRTALLQ